MNLSNETTASKQLAINIEVPVQSSAEAWLEKRIRFAEKGVFAEKISLTPELASVLLARNESNRTIKPAVFAEIIHDIRSKNWRLNGETIIVSKEGKLNDGQHRCMAVEKSGIAVETLITFGVTRESRTTVDTGGKKTVGDFISMDGAQNGNMAAAIAKMVWQYDSYGQIFQGGDRRPTSVETQNVFWENEKAIEVAIKSTPRSGSQKLGHFSMVAFAMFLLQRHNPDAAKTYMEALCKGSSLTEASPIYQARERLSSPAARRLKVAERLEIILRHWNAWRRNQRMQKPSPLQGELPAIED